MKSPQSEASASSGISQGKPEKKTQDKIDKNTNGLGKEEDDENKEEKSVLLNHEDRSFRKGEESIENLGAIKRRDREEIEASQYYVPENDQKKKSIEDTRK